MNAWLEAGAATLVALIGFGLGKWFAARPKNWWTIGYLIPLSLILVYVATLRFPAWVLVKPVSWLMLGRTKFAVFGWVAAMVLATPMHRLERPRERRAMGFLIIVFVCVTSVWPLLAPVFDQRQLAALKTRVDEDGVCIQGTDYTCGPAAAVTVLRRLGLPAEEGEIGIWARTSSATGALPEVLADTLQQHYRDAGLRAQFRIFKNVEELRAAVPTLAVVKFSFMLDHYVAVLGVTDTEVVVADPLAGLTRYSWPEFEDKWRKSGVAVERKQ